MLKAVAGLRLAVLLCLLAPCPSLWAQSEGTEHAVTLQDLDAIVTRAPDLDGFLRNPALIDE